MDVKYQNKSISDGSFVVNLLNTKPYFVKYFITVVAEETDSISTVQVFIPGAFYLVPSFPLPLNISRASQSSLCVISGLAIGQNIAVDVTVSGTSGTYDLYIH